MNRGFRTYALATAAAALMSGQAIAAAPANLPSGIDPFVALSVFGTAQSQSAVCTPDSTSTTAAGAAVAGAATDDQGQTPCVLPVTSGAPVAAAAPPPMYAAGGAPKGMGALPMFLGLAVLAAALVALATGGKGDGDGDLTPISPA